MRYFAIVLFSITTLFHASAQDSAPANQDAPFKQVAYKDVDDRSTLTLTGTDAAALEVGGEKLAGKYTIEGKTLHAIWTNTRAPDGITTTLHLDYDMSEDGMLSISKSDALYATPAAMEKAKAKVADKKCLSNARQIALGCRLYAADNGGKFPSKLGDLVPAYVMDRTLFVSPLDPKKEPMGYDYLGAGGTDSDAPNKILLRSRDTTPDGCRIIVYYDGSGEIKADKADKPDK